MKNSIAGIDKCSVATTLLNNNKWNLRKNYIPISKKKIVQNVVFYCDVLGECEKSGKHFDLIHINTWRFSSLQEC